MIRSTLKRGLKKMLGREDSTSAPTAYPFKYDDDAPAPVAADPVEAAPAEEAAAAEPAAEEPVAEEPVAEEPVAAAEEAAEAASMDPADDTVAGPALDPVEVQELLDEMVRPALQSDGGDINLVKIEGNDVYVKLVGSCSTCPSSIMTMKMGVEALFKEEFPNMGQLIHVE